MEEVFALCGKIRVFLFPLIELSLIILLTYPFINSMQMGLSIIAALGFANLLKYEPLSSLVLLTYSYYLIQYYSNYLLLHIISLYVLLFALSIILGRKCRSGTIAFFAGFLTVYVAWMILIVLTNFDLSFVIFTFTYARIEVPALFNAIFMSIGYAVSHD